MIGGLSLLIKRAAETSNSGIFLKLVEHILPELSQKDREACIVDFLPHAVNSDSKVISDFSEKFSELRSLSAYEYINKTLLEDSHLNPGSARLMDYSISNIGEYAFLSMNCISREIVNKNNREKLARNSELISKIASNHINKLIEGKSIELLFLSDSIEDSIFQSFSERSRSEITYLEFPTSSKISNEAIQSMARILRLSSFSYEGKKASVSDYTKHFFKGLNQYGSTLRLRADEIPTIRSGLIVNPELIIAASESGRTEIRVPFFICENSHKNDLTNDDIKFRSSMLLPVATEIRKSPSIYSRIEFLENKMPDPYFYAVADELLLSGATMPAGYKLGMAKISDFEFYPLAKASDEAIEKCSDLLSSMWVNPLFYEHGSVSVKNEFVCAAVLMDLIKECPENLESFKSNHLENKELMSFMANMYTRDYPRDKNDDFKVSGLSWVSRNLKAHPDMGAVTISKSSQIMELADSGFLFLGDCKIYDNLSREEKNIAGIAGYSMLIDMGADLSLYYGSKSEKEALERAVSRSEDVEYTAILRAFDFGKLIEICASEVEFDTLLLAFPDKSSLILPQMSANSKRKAIEMSLDI